MTQAEQTTLPSFQRQFLRNVGLGALSDIKSRGRRVTTEQKKIVVSTSRGLALSRCGVHILPILVSAAIIAVNFRQLFIGIDFASPIQSETVNLALLQIAAKLQELLIIASLATIVFQLVRDELLYGHGIPLGLIGAGISFTKLSFFWSPELLGSLKGLFKRNRKYRQIQLALFILLAGLLALFAGPACAVLLIPRQDFWPAGGTKVFLNGTEADFWPENILGSPSLEPFCQAPNGGRCGFCPSGGSLSLWSHYARLSPSTYKDVIPSYANDLSGNRYYWPVESTQPIAAKVMFLGDPLQRFILQPHLSTVILLDQLMQEWWPILLEKHGWKSRNIQDRQAVTSNVWTPYVRVSCAPAETLAAKDDQLTFPTNEAEISSRRVHNATIPAQPSEHLRFSWFSLPEFDSVSTGAVLQSPWSSDKQSRSVVACSIQAQWTPAHLRTEAFTFWQGWYPKNVTFDHSYPKKGVEVLKGSGKSIRNAIAFDDAWLRMLTPETPIAGPAYFDWGPTTMESILSSIDLFPESGNGDDQARPWDQQRDSDKYGLLASVIGSVFADGLSRYNVENQFTKIGDPSRWTISGYEKRNDFVKQLLRGKEALKRPMHATSTEIQLNFAISGLNYLNSLAQQLAMVVLFLHMLVALSHVVWTVIRGTSSDSWDSLTEILVLAQNSKPTQSLDNTCAGIKCSQTFARKVSIRPTASSTGVDRNADHLEFRVEEEEIVGDKELTQLQVPSGMHESRVQFRSRNASDVSQLSHSSTWPSHRRESTPSIVSYGNGPNMEIDSQPHTPLLGSSNRPPTSIILARVKHDHAYG